MAHRYSPSKRIGDLVGKLKPIAVVVARRLVVRSLDMWGTSVKISSVLVLELVIKRAFGRIPRFMTTPPVMRVVHISQAALGPIVERYGLTPTTLQDA